MVAKQEQNTSEDRLTCEDNIDNYFRNVGVGC